ncbi:Uncharacterised protein (plasmid) [Tsukamurella tyrosinosolvens]|uniref:Uncharacterized protein n=1 Tax=Tsukamurella tyrosinosolvens TaxID=57704 RepID=A0A1H4U2N4_TSUTY|nr:hypothetical protein [Tsukamurella tyrosinosolvens]KXO93032.1 hypothetical protein AXK58_14270 [Tsukamurella tyrosinosolvens]SEC63023.1 hypothetical protein SAMN04489793_2776 [Tsukamurella tyrosinosolvens]VEH93978.1 Uncharacterised protein [Tsukamurella tyrosinosolvens]
MKDKNGTPLAIGDRIIPNTVLVDGDLFSTAVIVSPDPYNRDGWVQVTWDCDESTGFAELADAVKFDGPPQ